MSQGKVTINGAMINLGAVKFFNKKERVSKNQPIKEKHLRCKDYGIEFGFQGGSTKVVWWFNDGQYDYVCSDYHQYERDDTYDRLKSDFNIREY